MGGFNREDKLLVLVILLALLMGGVFLFLQDRNSNGIVLDLTANEDLSLQESTGEKEKTKEALKIIVHVAGEVNYPGVYELPETARVFDALKAAGGETSLADLDNLNLARPLLDGEKIYVPQIKLKEEEGLNLVPKAQETSGKININQADSSQLQELPGIGPSKAESIVQYRKKHGPFQKIEDLEKVSGIGPKTVERLKEWITVW